MRAYLIVQHNLQPKCEECGYGIDRPNCTVGNVGYCRWSEQDDVVAFLRTLEQIQLAIDNAGVPPSRNWQHELPIHQIHEISETERNLLLDLNEGGGKQSTRSCDVRYLSLCRKGAVSMSVDIKWHVEITTRGAELLLHWEYRDEFYT